MPQSLIAFDTDHIKQYVFGTSRLKEIRGASSILDYLNRVETKSIAESASFRARTIYAHGGSALFVLDSGKAEQLGKRVQRLYHEKTGGGASITYAIQPIPDNYDPQEIMTIEMPDLLRLLRLRLRLAKDSQQAESFRDEPQQDNTVDMADIVALPSHPLLCTCNSCGANYAEDILKDPDDTDEPEDRYCRVCKKKREEDNDVKRRMEIASVSKDALWGHILQILSKKDASGTPLYDFWTMTRRPKDFNVFRDFTHGKDYLGLIYADANGMGEAMKAQKTLREVEVFAKKVDAAVFEAMGDAIRTHLPVQNDTFPFDILLIGGDDIVMVTPAEKALQVAHTLAERFHEHTNKQYTLSVGVILAPVKYPFSQQHELVEETLKAAKKSGSMSNTSGSSLQEQSCINFLVVTGNTSLSYQKQYGEMHRKEIAGNKNEFYATQRPYTLSNLTWLLGQLRKGSDRRLGRTKLHQLREAILKMNNTTSILEALALLRNWKKEEREFIKDMVNELDTRQTTKQQQMGILFPWYLDGKESNGKHTIYRTPLLDFVELYDFVSF